MTPLDKSNWITETNDLMEASITAILRAAGLGLTGQRYDHYSSFAIYETVTDAIKEDMSDWLVKHPDFASRFAEGKVQFILGEDENNQVVLSKTFVNPTWADVLVVAEMSCIGRGAPELDHVFLEAVEQDGVGADGTAFYELHWGS